MYTQDMNGNRSFPEKPSPDAKPSIRNIPSKLGPDTWKGHGGYGEQGDGIEINDEAPAGNIRPANGGKFVQNQMHAGTDLNAAAPVESTIRDIRVADLGAGFGRGPLEGSLEIAGEKRGLRKWFPTGGRSI